MLTFIKRQVGSRLLVHVPFYTSDVAGARTRDLPPCERPTTELLRWHASSYCIVPRPVRIRPLEHSVRNALCKCTKIIYKNTLQNCGECPNISTYCEGCLGDPEFKVLLSEPLYTCGSQQILVVSAYEGKNLEVIKRHYLRMFLVLYRCCILVNFEEIPCGIEIIFCLSTIVRWPL